MIGMSLDSFLSSYLRFEIASPGKERRDRPPGENPGQATQVRE